ncbi:MAG: protein kinase [Bacillota bacterium]|nr:protein kinase [Bacillota bacterium]
MKKSSTDHPPQSDQHQFLQDSSLLTWLPPEQRSQGQESPIVLPKADQKIISPVKPVLAQLDSQGGIHINITIPASALTLGRLLGKGGFGAVYEGIYNDKPVAIKQLSTHLTADTLKELKREAEIMFQLGLESDYVVPLKKICLEAPHYSLVMELMPKGSLYDLLHNGQDLPWAIRFQIALDAAWGLKDLHGYPILHRDLKSLNILLDNHLRAKLADFGLAKVKHESSSQSSVAKGTVLWMAPELFDDEPKMTTASDVYSFGMVLWELVTRLLPYAKAPNQHVAARWIEKGKKEDIPGDCPRGLKSIIESCWESLPASRPTAVQLVERLKPLVMGQEQKVQVPVSSTAPESPKPAQASGSNDEEMKKLLAEVMRMKLKEAEDERRRQALEKQVEEHERLKAEVEREREIKRREAELKKSPVVPKPETPASSPPARQPEIKKPKTLEPVPPLSSVLSQSRFTIAPKPVIPQLDRGIPPVDAKALEQLLRLVTEGEQDKAEALIQKDRNLLLHAGTVTDLSGREFKQITGFQYALWAMDWHMWKMIQKYLPEEQQREQFEVLETKGTAHGKHFSVQPLIGALQTYVDNADKVWKYDQRATDHWIKVVGGAQKLLPAHVVDEYCHPKRAFDPCPDFKENDLPRSRICEVYDGGQWIKGEWFTSKYNGGAVGEKFAFVRGGGELYGWQVCEARVECVCDLKALQSLSKTRIQQLELLASQLKLSSSGLVLR